MAVEELEEVLTNLPLVKIFLSLKLSPSEVEAEVLIKWGEGDEWHLATKDNRVKMACI